MDRPDPLSAFLDYAQQALDEYYAALEQACEVALVRGCGVMVFEHMADNHRFEIHVCPNVPYGTIWDYRVWPGWRTPEQCDGHLGS